jgi:membrane-associated phospholipid phosphatase
MNWKILIVILILNVLIDFIKSIIKQPRPPGAANCDLLNMGGPSTSYGMPSGHVTMFTAMLVFMGVPLEWVALGTTLMSWSRVTRGCHTLEQSLIGGIFGFIFATITKKLIVTV